MKRVLISLAGVGLLAYGGTVAYLQHYDRKTAPTLSESSPTKNNPVTLAAFKALNDARCDYCHTNGRNLPFYFSLPVAHSIMAKDLYQGKRHFRLEPVLTAFDEGKPPSEESLSRIEEVIVQNRMPPAKYLLLHWHARLSKNERQAILKWIQETRSKYYATTGATPSMAGEPIRPIPETVPVNFEKVALGHKLFFDKKLSGDNTLNCASCHKLEEGGVDHLVTATGIDGQKGPINTPSVYDAYFKIAQFWNGRAPDLAAQAAGPIMNPIEMGSHDWSEVAGKLSADPDYMPMFKAAFGPDVQIGQDTITEAIAEYEKTLITPDSPFDEYLKGKENAISEQAKRGYARFKAIGCSGCHSGIDVGGGAYEIMGLEGNYFKDRGGQETDADKGVYVLDHKDEDLNRFVVPTLRNIELTAPYFHDGSAKTLEDAVRKMSHYQTPVSHPSDQDVTDIVAFLKTLTGKVNGQELHISK